MKHEFVACLLFAAAAAGCSRAGGSEAAGDVALRRNAFADAIAGDSILQAAADAIEQGHPWVATQMLAPLLKSPATRTPPTCLLAARAAAAWGGWDQVESLLASQPWLDTQDNGAARELLARSALERGADAEAVGHANAAVNDAANATVRSDRLVLLARALDRSNQRDSARATYARAAMALPDAKSWLLLRAAGVDGDSARRAQSYAAIREPVARARIAWTEAQALERNGDISAAAARYAALGGGATVISLRLQLSVPHDEAARNRLKAELLAYLRARPGASDARTAVEVLDANFPSLAPSEELLVARTAAISGPLARGVTAYARALAGGAAAPADVLQYGELLARAGRWHDAIAQFDAVDSSAAVAPQAGYQRARALLSLGQGDAARAQLRVVASRYAGDTSAAAPALYLLADLTTDDGRDDEARALFLDVASRYPTYARAGEARFHAAVIDFVGKRFVAAARELDSLATAKQSAGEMLAAQYWSGRSWAAAGNKANAAARWRDVVKRDSQSYYAFESAQRLHIPPWIPAERNDSIPRNTVVEATIRRIGALERLGMDVEAHFEYDALDSAASQSVDRLLATASALQDHGQPWRASRLAARALERSGGPRDARVYRLLFPVWHREVLAGQARQRGLAPELVAGIIRQESGFNPRAVSVAGARGLMQVLPSVGQQVAGNLHFPVWEPALLFDADANLEIGAAHLATYVKQYGDLSRVLAAYNAGGSRASRWANKSGVDDPELFVERIPFAETRDYVRYVERNEMIYRQLYRW